jgi:hypothetical protein
VKPAEFSRDDLRMIFAGGRICLAVHLTTSAFDWLCCSQLA